MTACDCAACRARAGETVAPVPLTDGAIRSWRERYGLREVPSLIWNASEPPADLRAFVEGM